VGPIELLNQLTKNVLETALAAIWSLRRGGERDVAGCVWEPVVADGVGDGLPVIDPDPARTQARTW
jgi:hypothetical protein